MDFKYDLIAKFQNGVSESVCKGNNIKKLIKIMEQSIANDAFVSPVKLWWIEENFGKGNVVHEGGCKYQPR